jgi:ribonuclease P protein subunit POP4
MKVTAEIIRDEFIGTEAKVSKSKHIDYLGLSGKIVDETRNTFTILDGGERKVIGKSSAVFRLSLHDGAVVEVDGKLLTGRPEDRLKKTIRRLW